MVAQLTESFVEISKAAQIENIILTKEEFKTVLAEKGFSFAQLDSPFKTFNKSCEFLEEGIESAIVSADQGIAETGTLVIDSTDEKIRLATCLAEHLYVVLKKSSIVNKLENIISYMNEKNSEDNAYIAFISGASRTADIERVLTIGVHGPQKMTVYIIEDL